MATKKSNVAKFPNAYQFQLGSLTLQLRLLGRDILKIEDRLGESINGLFMKNQGEMKVPATKKLLIILSGANQTSGIKDSDIIEAFEEYINEGHSTMELMTEIMKFLEEQGFFGKNTDNETLTLEVAEETEEETLL